MVLSWFWSLFKQKEQVSCLSFSNAPKDKKEYEQRKKQKIDYAFSDFYFWDKLDTTVFIKNTEYALKNVCPYCQAELPERKGKSFKCPACKNKVHKSNDYYSGNEIILTDDEKAIQNQQYEELSKRKKFLEIYQYVDKIILPVPTVPEIGQLFKQNATDNKADNIQLLLSLLHEGIPEYYQKKNRRLTKLRDCRFYEGAIQRLYGSKEQARNAFMQILFLDMLDDFDTIYSSLCLDSDLDIDDNGKFILTKEQKAEIIEQAHKEFKEKEIFIAPAIYGGAFEEDLPLEQYKGTFIINASNLCKSLKFEVPMTSEDAWNKVLEYREKELLCTNTKQ